MLYVMLHISISVVIYVFMPVSSLSTQMLEGACK